MSTELVITHSTADEWRLLRVRTVDDRVAICSVRTEADRTIGLDRVPLVVVDLEVAVVIKSFVFDAFCQLFMYHVLLIFSSSFPYLFSRQFFENPCK